MRTVSLRVLSERMWVHMSQIRKAKICRYVCKTMIRIQLALSQKSIIQRRPRISKGEENRRRINPLTEMRR